MDGLLCERGGRRRKFLNYTIAFASLSPLRYCALQVEEERPSTRQRNDSCAFHYLNAIRMAAVFRVHPPECRQVIKHLAQLYTYGDSRASWLMRRYTWLFCLHTEAVQSTMPHHPPTPHSSFSFPTVKFHYFYLPGSIEHMNFCL